MNGLADTITTALNSPDCSILVGGYLGTLYFSRFLFFAVISYAIIKAVDKLAFDPFLNYCKKKINNMGAKK